MKTSICITLSLAIILNACEKPSKMYHRPDRIGDDQLVPDAEIGKPLPKWQEGCLDIHYINSARGECTFYILPDGTTMLVDAGETTLDIAPKPNASVPAYDEVTRKFGITFKDISLDEVKQEYDRAAMVNKDLLPGVFDDSEKVKALRVFGAFKTITEKYGLSGFTVRCFDLLKPLATTGCAGLALLNDEGVTAACEGDIAALISMHIVRLLTGQPSFQANPSRITPADNTMVLAHCTIPLAMTGDIRLDTHFESGTGVAIKGYLREEDVTIFRLSADLKSFFVSDGKIIKNLDEPDLCRTQILVKFEEDVSEILKKPCGNHHIVFYGHHAEDIRRVMRSIL